MKSKSLKTAISDNCFLFFFRRFLSIRARNPAGDIILTIPELLACDQC